MWSHLMPFSQSRICALRKGHWPGLSGSDTRALVFCLLLQPLKVVLLGLRSLSLSLPPCLPLQLHPGGPCTTVAHYFSEKESVVQLRVLAKKKSWEEECDCTIGRAGLLTACQTLHPLIGLSWIQYTFSSELDDGVDGILIKFAD